MDRLVEHPLIGVATRQCNLFQIPTRGDDRIGIGADSEECQLEAVARTVGRFEVARVVPPFGAELIMTSVVARKCVGVPRERQLKAFCRRNVLSGECGDRCNKENSENSEVDVIG